MGRTLIGIQFCAGLIAIAGSIGVVAAHATERNSPREAAYEHSIRFKVVAVAEVGPMQNGRLLQLTVQRWYGKIDTKSLKRNQEYETQEFTILFPVAPEADVKTGDIIDYRMVGILSDGNSVKTLSPSAPDPPPEAAKEDAPRFSETHELVLSMNSLDSMLDLDTGETMDPPARFRPAEARMDLRTDQMQPYDVPKGLIGLELQGMEVEASDWDASAAEVRRTLVNNTVGPLKELKLGPETRPTYFFRTRDGAYGVLQLMEIVDEPKGIRLRYKRLESEPAIITAPGGERARP